MPLSRQLLQTRKSELTYVGDAYAVSASTLTPPAHSAGDLFVMLAQNFGSALSVPAGWTTLKTGNFGSYYGVLAYKVAASTSEGSGTWSNADRLALFVWRGARADEPIAASANNMNGDDFIVPALTCTYAGSWICAVGLTDGNNFTDGDWPSTWTGMTPRLIASVWRRAWDSDGPKASLSQINFGGSNEFVYYAASFEVRPA